MIADEFEAAKLTASLRKNAVRFVS